MHTEVDDLSYEEQELDNSEVPAAESAAPTPAPTPAPAAHGQPPAVPASGTAARTTQKKKKTQSLPAAMVSFMAENQSRGTELLGLLANTNNIMEKLVNVIANNKN